MNPFRQMIRMIALLGTLALVACSSTPTHYYTLVGPAPSGAAAASAGYAIEVLPVSVPAQVDIKPLVLRAGDGRLAIEDAHEWAAPLPDEIRQALSQDLTGLLGAEDLYGLPQDGVQRLYRIKLVVTRFDSTYGQAVDIEARWSVRALSDKHLLMICSSREREPVARGYGALVTGHQHALRALSRRIAAGVRELRRGQSVCPQS